MIRKIHQLLYLRTLQGKRMLESVGYVLFIVFIIVAFGLMTSVIANLYFANRWWAIGGAFLTLGSIDYFRNDKLFLKTIFVNRVQLSIYTGVEYLIIILPMMIFQIAIGNYVINLILFISALMMGLLSTYIATDAKSAFKKEVKIIPLKFFEIKFAVESSPLLYSALWLFGLFSFLHIGIYLFWLFMILTSLHQIFITYEPKEMIHWHPSFVFKKFREYCIFISIVSLIPTLIALIFSPDLFLLIFYGLFSLYTSLFLAIVIKYASYNPLKAKSQVSAIASIFILLVIIPGGVLITLVFALYKYFQAESNLRYVYA